MLFFFWVCLPSSFCYYDHSLVHGLAWNCCKLYYLSKGQRGQDRLWDSVKFKDIQWGRAFVCFNNPRQLTSEAAFHVQLKHRTQVVVYIHDSYFSGLLLVNFFFFNNSFLVFNLSLKWQYFYGIPACRSKNPRNSFPGFVFVLSYTSEMNNGIS